MTAPILPNIDQTDIWGATLNAAIINVELEAATADAKAVAAKVRDNHTGTQTADTITDGATNKVFTDAERTKLQGIATGATLNDLDANLKARGNHTGFQLASTISDFNTAIIPAVAAAVATAGVGPQGDPGEVGPAGAVGEGQQIVYWNVGTQSWPTRPVSAVPVIYKSLTDASATPPGGASDLDEWVRKL